MLEKDTGISVYFPMCQDSITGLKCSLEFLLVGNRQTPISQATAVLCHGESGICFSSRLLNHAPCKKTGKKSKMQTVFVCNFSLSAACYDLGTQPKQVFHHLKLMKWLVCLISCHASFRAKDICCFKRKTVNKVHKAS